MNRRLASGFLRRLPSISRRLWSTSLSALGWMSSSWRWARWNSRINFTGSRLKPSFVATLTRPPLISNPSISGLRNLSRNHHDGLRTFCCWSSRTAQSTRVRSPTALAVRK